jgi:hypothetical protein
MKNKLMMALIGSFLVLALTVSCGGGGSSSNNNGGGGGGGGGGGNTDRATASVTSTTSGQVITPSGAGVTVPVGAVPLTEGGQTGTMVFSAEKTTTVTATPPNGEAVASNVYLFGPDGFVFAAPVKVTVPVPNATTNDKVYIYRIDQTTHVATRYPGVYDQTTHTVSAYTDRLSPWFATTGSANSTADGAVRLVNTSSNKWLSGCVEHYSLSHPSASGYDFGEASAAPMGTIGWNSTINWGLAQGTYDVCLSMHTSGTESDRVHWLVNNVSVNQASVYPDYRTSHDFSYGSAPTGADSGPCGCTPTPTPSAGTGDVQITLSWHVASPGVDLDLHVIEPSGEEIYYGHLTSATGGQLDLDNKCSNYVDGRPENVFWPTGGAPRGTYTVKVDWFSDCGTGSQSLSYDVRVINKGSVTTYPGTIGIDQEVTATTFTVQ